MTMAVKRALRPIVPDVVVDRYHRFQGARQARVNVDVVVDDAAGAARWLATIPNTYRVRSRSSFRPAALDEAGVVVLGSGLGAEPTALLGDQTVSAVVLGEAAPPSIGAPGTEPRIAPLGVATTMDVIRDVRYDARSADLVMLVDLLRQAGHRLVLVPRPVSDGRWERSDPIEAPCIVLLAMVPMHDVGGGSRGAQLAQELLARGYHVVYVQRFASTESSDPGVRVFHPKLEQVWFEDFDAAGLARRAKEGGLVIVEAPTRKYVTTAIALGEAGFKVVYDLIDNWTDEALGAEWYRPAMELKIADAADALIASSTPLAGHLQSITGRDAALVPNGVNHRIFDGTAGSPPGDLPKGEGPLIGYHGSLYGDWFDWEALAALAKARPEARIVLIGDPRNPPSLPNNVTLLGLRPQTELPPYVASFDVGLVPFQVSATTHAVSPLKAFECLAMGVPVAAPPLRALQAIAGVYVDDDLRMAVARALEAPRPDGASARERHSWSERVGHLLAAAGMEPNRTPGSPPRIEVRPATRYPIHKRRVR